MMHFLEDIVGFFQTLTISIHVNEAIAKTGVMEMTTFLYVGMDFSPIEQRANIAAMPQIGS